MTNQEVLPLPVDQYVEQAADGSERIALSILSDARDIEIADEDMNLKALDLLDRARRGKKHFNKARLELTKPLNDYVSDINARYKDKVAPLEEADAILTEKTGAWHAEKVRKQREEEERVEKIRRDQEAKIEAARKIEQMRAEAEARPPEEVKIPETFTAPAPVMPVAKTTETQSGSKMTMREHTDITIENDDLVPREFCSGDMKKIKEAVSNGFKDIPGVRITKTYRPAQR